MLVLCITEAMVSLIITVSTVLFFGKPLLAIFNNDPEVVAIGYIRLLFILPSHFFSMLYESMSGYLRGFGISLVPALLTMMGVCGIRIAWIHVVFQKNATFQTIMTVYPISLGVTAMLMIVAVMFYRPSCKYAHMQKIEGK